MCDKGPCLSGCNGPFPILRQSWASVHPRERSLHDPAPGRDFEAFGRVGSLDDLQGPGADLLQGTTEFRAGVAAIGEDMAQPGQGEPDRFEDARRTVAVLDIGPMDRQPDRQAQRVGDDRTLAALDLLAGVIAPIHRRFAWVSPTGCRSRQPLGTLLGMLLGTLHVLPVPGPP